MDRFKIKKDSVWGTILSYAVLFLAVMILFMIVYKTGFQKHVQAIQLIMSAGVFISLGAGLYVSWKHNFDLKYVTVAFIAAGLVMRIGYMLYTPFNIRSHDLGDVTPDGYGHAAYILKLMVNHKLPETNWIQFYHPPLYHFLAACVCTFVNIFMKWSTYEEVLEAAKIVSCFASAGCLLIMPKLCDELGLTQRAKAFAAAVIAFFPNCYLLAGRVNNDSLVIFFMMTAILYTFKWAKEQSWKNTLILAFAFGLGMMTKVSCGTLALFTGPIMIAIFFKHIREKNWIPLFKKLVSFGILVFPLGLWYPIRNLIKFNQPLNYVVDIGKDSKIYTGNVSFFLRYIQFPLKNLLEPVYAHPWDDSNINLYVIKSAMFGEFEYNITDFIPKVLVVSSLVLVLCSLFAMIYMAVKIRTNKMLRLGIPVLWVLLYGFFLYFNGQYPYGCTMDFRYIVPTAFIGAVCLGTAFDYFWKQNTLTAIIYKITVTISGTLFILFSVLMYCLIK